MSDASQPAAAGSSELKRDLDSLRADFDRLLKDLSASLLRGGGAAAKAGEEALSAARSQAAAAGDDLSQRVRDNPLTACAIAVGIGVALGLLLSGGRK